MVLKTAVCRAQPQKNQADSCEIFTHWTMIHRPRQNRSLQLEEMLLARPPNRRLHAMIHPFEPADDFDDANKRLFNGRGWRVMGSSMAPRTHWATSPVSTVDDRPSSSHRSKESPNSEELHLTTDTPLGTATSRYQFWYGLEK